MTNYSFVNVCKFAATTGGTGSFVVSSAVTGYLTPASAGAANGNYRYRAESADLTLWEIGSAAYTSSNVTLTRTVTINSVGGTSAINFTAAPQVGLVLSANDFQGTGQILGSDGTSSAAAGNIAEYVSAQVFSTSPVATGGSGVNTQVTSLSIPSGGDWRIDAFCGVLPSSTMTSFLASISSFSSGFPSDLANLMAIQLSSNAFTPGGRFAYPQGSRRWLTANATTVYLVAQVGHGSSASLYGTLEGSRRR